jgi:predicted DCC family thiol-disulfide oxidoreductase YuxK
MLGLPLIVSRLIGARRPVCRSTTSAAHLSTTDANENLIVGTDVAIAIWQLTPGEGWLATLLGNRVTLPFTRFFL